MGANTEVTFDQYLSVLGGHSDGQGSVFNIDAIKVCQGEPFLYLHKVSKGAVLGNLATR